MINDWTCFTSFNRRLYDIIAAEMLASWLHHWPQQARLVIYLEDDIDLPADPRLEIRSWSECCGAMFQQVHALAGDALWWQSEHTRRYTKKGLTFVHMLDQPPGPLCWLDADLLTIKPVDQDILDRAMSGDHVVSLFDGSREPNRSTAWTAESGFVLLDPGHPAYLDFSKHYRYYYDHAVMPAHASYFWDGEILMHAARQGQSYFDLRSECQGKSSTPIHSHWLGQYFTHMKSKRKKHYSLDTYRDYWLKGEPIATAKTIHSWQR